MVHETFKHLTVKTIFCESFDVIFSGTRRINRTIIRLVLNGAEYVFFYLPNSIDRV